MDVNNLIQQPQFSQLIEISPTAVIATSVICLALFVLGIFVNWKLFKMAGEAGWKAIIPIYNVYTETKIVWGNGLLFLLLIIPGVNLAFAVIHNIKKARVYDRGLLFGIGLIFLPMIFGLILVLQRANYLGPEEGGIKMALIAGLVVLALMLASGYFAAQKMVDAMSGMTGLIPENALSISGTSEEVVSESEEELSSKKISQFFLASTDKERNFEVEKGTSKEDIVDQLPMTVRVTAGGETQNLRVMWDSDDYDETEYGEYTFYMMLPDTYEVEDGVEVPEYLVSINPPEDEIIDTEPEVPEEEEEEPTMTQTSNAPEEEEEDEPSATATVEPSGPPAQIPQEQAGDLASLIILGDKDNRPMTDNHVKDAAFLTGNGGGASWLTSDGIDRAINLAAEGATIVIIPGTESMGEAKAYAEAANKASEKLGMISGNVYVTSVPPTSNEAMNEQIRKFNDSVYEELDDTVGYIDLYYKLAKDGFSNASDGITLASESATKAFQYIKQATGK